MGTKHVNPKWVRIFKVAMMCTAFIAAFYAYLNPDKSGWFTLMAYYTATVTGLVAWEYWDDRLLRLIAFTAFLASLNNLADEVFFNPLEMGVSEAVFGLTIAVNLIYQLTRIFADGHKTDE